MPGKVFKSTRDAWIIMLLCLSLFKEVSAMGCSFKASFTGDSVVCSGTSVVYQSTYNTGHYYRWTCIGGEIVKGNGTVSLTIYWPSPGNGYVKLIDSTSNCKDSAKLKVKAGLSSSVLMGSDYAYSGVSFMYSNTQYVTGIGPGEYGAVWCKNSINLNQNFDIFFQIKQTPAGPKDGGMVFVLQNSGLSSTSGTSNGGNMGYYNAPTGIFDQSLGIEFDIVNSGAGYYDSSGSHMSLVKNKSPFPLRKQVNISPNLANNSNRYLRVKWDRNSNLFRVYLDGKMIFSYNSDIVKNIFGDKPNVWFGFTASTGVSTIFQTFRMDTVYYSKATIKTNSFPEICEGDTAVFTASAGISYLWSTGDTTRSIKVYKSGTYGVQVQDSNNCISTADSLKIVVDPYPINNPGKSHNICLGSILNLGRDSAIPGYTYEWTSSPTGYFSSQVQDTVTPIKNTTYILKVTSGLTACSSIDSFSIKINPGTIVNFKVADGCTGVPLVITNGTIPVTGTNVRYFWKFGDGTFSKDRNPVKSYSKSGIFSVWLYAITDSGCSDSAFRRVYIKPSPKPLFSAGNFCLGQTTHFSNYTQIPGGNIQSSKWDFGDLTYSINASPDKTYASPGKYNVTLVVTTDLGCKDSVTDTIRIYPYPKALFNYHAKCLHTPVIFYNTSSITPGYTIKTYLWKFGDIFSLQNDTTSQPGPEHPFSDTGTYLVSLKAIGETGCSTSFSEYVHISAHPESFPGIQQYPCFKVPVHFLDSSLSHSKANIQSWNWDFGDQQNSFLQNPVHTYPDSGTYKIILIIQTSEGCLDTAYRLIKIFPLPDAGFKPVWIADRTYQFKHNDSLLKLYQWFFGDGDYNTGENVTHKYLSDSTYTAILKVTDKYACTNLYANNIDVITSSIPTPDKNTDNMTLSPNPAKNESHLQYYLIKRTQVNIMVTDIKGNELFPVLNNVQDPGMHNQLINFRNKTAIPGVYFLRFTTGNQSKILPLIIQ